MRKRDRTILSGPARACLALLLAVLSAAASPGPAVAQAGAGDADRAEAETSPAGHLFLGGYGILAYDPAARQLGLAVASGGFSAASGLPWLEQGTGAAAVLGRRAPAAGRAALEALRAGDPAREATDRAVEAVGDSGGLQLAVLSPDCGSSSFTAEDAHEWSGSRSGRVDGTCYVATGALLSDPTVLARAVEAFRGTDAPLLERFQAFLEAAERATGDVARSKSAALWIDAPDAENGALGRATLRLQVDDVQRPADALRYLVRAGRADALARRASGAVDRGALERAVTLADSAVAREPTSALAWLAKGRALLFQGRDREAETALQRMLEVNPHLLHVLGDPGRAAEDTLSEAGGPMAAPEADETAPTARSGLIPYRPRLLLRLDVYRRAFHRDAEFPEEGTGADR